MKHQALSEHNRFALISGLILVVGCLGGLTVGMGAIRHVFTLMLVVFPTMITLSLLLAVAPMGWILRAAFVTITIDILLLGYFLL
ncbi:MAG: hypothetical protein ACKO4K_02825 [Flavobacteriales bacterium]|jgi:hypothetical protein